MVSICTIFWSMGGHFVNANVYFNKIFDVALGTEVYGFYFLSFTVGNIINILLK